MKRRMVGSKARSAVPAVAAVGAALVVASCAAGQITQTDTQVAAIDGTSADIGNIEIRNAEIASPASDGSGPAVYPKGSDAEAVIWLVNEGEQPDELVSARSDAAQKATLEGSRVVPPERTLVLSPEPMGTGNPVQGSLTLEGLKHQLRPGEMVEVTLTFRDAGQVTFELPVTMPDEPRNNPAEPPGQGGH